MSRKLSQRETSTKSVPKQPPILSDRQRRRRAIFATARQHGLDLKQFGVETSEQQDFYKVVFLPSDRKRWAAACGCGWTNMNCK
jgi:hypothetical protein